jgi:hypothetical protein
MMNKGNDSPLQYWLGRARVPAGHKAGLRTLRHVARGDAGPPMKGLKIDFEANSYG